MTLSNVLALLQITARRSSGGQVLQVIKAFIGLAMIIIVPTVAIYWARKRWRP